MAANSQILAGLLGLAVGDALGVPVEFSSRQEREENPVETMMGYGTDFQPPGTWSDDSSLSFCLAEALIEEVDPTEVVEATARNFCRWYKDKYWTPHGHVFDIGFTTLRAIERLQAGVPPTEAGGKQENNNGNGALMRILPLAFACQSWSLPVFRELINQISGITHAHQRSQIACQIYLEIACNLLQDLTPKAAYQQAISVWKNQELYYLAYPEESDTLTTFDKQENYEKELKHFQRILNGHIDQYQRSEISSSGYVVHTLEAALWCLINSHNYTEAVLTAINLGGDTDTTGAVTGGLAGIYYGVEDIPESWRLAIAKRESIENLALRLANKLPEF